MSYQATEINLTPAEVEQLIDLTRNVYARRDDLIELRTRIYELLGMTRSDAQGCVAADINMGMFAVNN